MSGTGVKRAGAEVVRVNSGDRITFESTETTSVGVPSTVKSVDRSQGQLLSTLLQ